MMRRLAAAGLLALLVAGSMARLPEPEPTCLEPVAVATRDLPVGHSVDATAVTVEQRPCRAPDDPGVPAATLLNHRVPVRPIRAGETVRSRLLAPFIADGTSLVRVSLLGAQGAWMQTGNAVSIWAFEEGDRIAVARVAWVSEVDASARSAALLMAPADADRAERYAHLPLSFETNRRWTDPGPMLGGWELYE
ncbi:MAG: SAF domain-containing protein [Myxococcota bacterium]